MILKSCKVVKKRIKKKIIEKIPFSIKKIQKNNISKIITG